MDVRKSYVLWLSLSIVILGALISVLTAYVVEHHLKIYWITFLTLKNHLPWVILSVGLGIFSVLALILYFMHLTQQQKIYLLNIKESLKKEVQERLQVEESKQKLEIALLQGQKLQAMGTLASGIAHDFNNLLYAIIGYVEMSRDDVPKDSLVYKNLGRVLTACHRGRELIARILAFSRSRQNHQFEIINLNQTIDAALALLRPTIPASVQIAFKSHYKLMVMGNQTQLHQVMVNIINNAVDAMDGEGNIIIETETLLSDDPYLKQFPEIKHHSYCKIDISDTGHGMDLVTTERIFEPFYTTKEVGKGTGLGLSIVHSIIKEHQGDIAVTSTIGKGSTFTILLPEYINPEVSLVSTESLSHKG